MKKRVLLVAIILAPILMILTSCWNYSDLGGFTIAIGFGYDDAGDDRVSGTMQVLNLAALKSGGGKKQGGSASPSGKAYINVTTIARSAYENARKSTKLGGRKLFTPHAELMVFGEELAKRSILAPVDIFYRDHWTNPIINLVVARGTAKDILDAESAFDPIPVRAIVKRIQGATGATSEFISQTMYEFVKTLSSKIPGGYIGAVRIAENGEVEMDGTAIFRKDKMVGWFDDSETRGLLWVINKVKTGALIIKAPVDETKHINLEIIKASGDVKPVFKNGKPGITCKIKVDLNLVEQHVLQNMTKPDMITQMEKRADAVIKDEINSALKKAQKEWALDIFKFGEAFHRKYPDKWKLMENNWEEIYKNMDVEITAESRINKTFMINSIGGGGE